MKCYIKISKGQLDLINSEEGNKKITYEIFNNQVHNKREIEVTQDNIRTEKENEILAISLIKQNITEPLEFHINNFKNNNIDYGYIKIKNLLQQVREADIPKDEIILSDIAKIKINYDNNDKNEEGVPFCLSKCEFINLS